MAKLSLAKLERHLYSAADRLRQEGLDAATYKDYIFGLLFLKRCSDVFEAEREKLIEERIAKGCQRPTPVMCIVDGERFLHRLPRSFALFVRISQMNPQSLICTSLTIGSPASSVHSSTSILTIDWGF